MNQENEEVRISKHNRRKKQEAEKQREIIHPFKIITSTPKRKDVDRRAHLLERKALKK